ncbi:MAG: DUF3096 domain-containing protein [Candidatus Woesearchaeota archaeon]
MVISVSIAGLLSAILSLVFGIIIIKWKKSLNYLIGFYFILIGILGLLAVI